MEIPSEVHLTKFAPPIFDQGGTGSCVGHARSRGLYITRRAAGFPLPFVPSPADLYRLARCYSRKNWHEPLQDFGSDPVETINAVMAFGIRPMTPMQDRYSDADPKTINDLPTLSELEADSEFRFLDDHQINETGANRIQAVCASLAAGIPVCLDVEGGSKEFQEYSGGKPLAAHGSSLDHYVCLTGYRQTAYGTVFEGDNSWNIDWGIMGRFEADESVITYAGDLIACVENERRF